MKVLTLTQPWASLVAVGAKRVETRSWYCGHFGPLAIHAAKGFPRAARAFAERRDVLDALYNERLSPSLLPRYSHWNDLPLGAVVAIVEMRECLPTGCVAVEEALRERPREREFGDYSHGRWAWMFDRVQAISATPARGALGLWEWRGP